MKKTIRNFAVASALVLLGNASFGQTSLGIRGGVNFQNINGENANGDKLDNSLMTGFNAGLNVEFPVATDFYLQPGLLYSVKGADAPSKNDYSWKLNYIELPVNFIYKPQLGSGKLLLGFGPYVAYGLGGTAKSDNLPDLDVKFTNDANTFESALNGETHFKPLDAGANILFGYEFASRLSAQVNAQLGMLNLNVDDNDAKFKNTGFGVSLGYRFGGQ